MRSKNALLRLAFAVAPGITPLTKPHTANSLARSTKSTQSPRRAPTPYKRIVSGTISSPSPGCFSPFPHGTSSLSISEYSLALEGGPPRFKPDFTCPTLLRILLPYITYFTYGTITLYRHAFQRVQLYEMHRYWSPTTPR